MTIIISIIIDINIIINSIALFQGLGRCYNYSVGLFRRGWWCHPVAFARSYTYHKCGWK
jgi:hypothetical protein